VWWTEGKGEPIFLLTKKENGIEISNRTDAGSQKHPLKNHNLFPGSLQVA
jgi:hypothetical protein